MNIYVANIPFKVHEDELGELFAAYGEVTSAKIIFDKLTNRSRGFGFVEMAVEEEGHKAIEALNGTDFQGKEIAVSEARPRKDFTPKQHNNRGGFGGNRGGGFNRGGGGGNRGGFNRDRSNDGGGGGYRRPEDNNAGGFRRSEENTGFNREHNNNRDFNNG